MIERRQPDQQALRERVDARLQLAQQLLTLSEDLSSRILEAARGACTGDDKRVLVTAADHHAWGQVRYLLAAVEREGRSQPVTALLTEDERAALLGPAR